MIITLMGNDGSGKTTIAKKLLSLLKSTNQEVIYEHEYEYGLLKTFFKILGEKRLTKSKLEFIEQRQKRMRYYIWPFMVFVDRLINYWYFRIFKKDAIVILDRYIYDHYMSFRYSGHMTRIAKWLYLNFPKPDVGVNLWADSKVAFERKKDSHTFPLDFYVKQNRDYKILADFLNIERINTEGPIEDTVNKIMRLIIKNRYKKQTNLINDISKVSIYDEDIKKLSIVIPAFNDKKFGELLKSLQEEVGNSKADIEIMIIDDSEENHIEEVVNKYKNELEKIAKIYLIKSGGRKGPTYCRNLGASKATGDLLFFIDDDNRLSGKVLHTVCEFMKTHTLVGLTGIVNFMPNGKIWCLGGRIDRKGPVVFIGNTKDKPELPIKIVDFIPNLYVIRKKIFDEIGGFDERFSIYFEEGDLALRVWKKGYIVGVIINENAYTVHLVNDTADKPMRPERYYLRGKHRVLFYAKHYKHLLKWRCIPDILLRASITYRYKIPFKKRKSMVNEYIKGTKDALSTLE